MKLKIILGSIIILLVFLFIYLYQFLGMKYLLNAISYIELPYIQNRSEAYDLLSNSHSPSNLKRGILGRINNGNHSLNGVWIWDLKGVKYYRADDKTAYSYFSMCDDEEWKKQGAMAKKTIDSQQWEKRAKPGDYVEMATHNNSNIQEIVDYDWLFLVKPLPWDYFENTCKNR